ncbi:hypothetical protein ACFPL7_24090 [Dongia soli]|uniref:Uncharacterized protein n=1 Tax=Dongia soli TaxID=600628 RepID=A0ABU5EG46_9PROT|nr:hypothetical protein [Dongia soli]
MVYRWIVGLPKSAFDLFDKLRAASSKRAGYYGVYKDLGVLFGQNASYLSYRPPARRFMKEMVHQYYALLNEPVYRSPKKRAEMADGSLIPIYTAIKTFKVAGYMMRRLLVSESIECHRPSADVRTPIFVRRSQLEEILEERKRLCRAEAACEELGIPEHTLSTLSADGLIDAETGPAAIIAGDGRWFSQSKIGQLKSRLVETSSWSDRPEEDRISVRDFFALHKLSARAWTPLLRAVMAGTISLRSSSSSDQIGEATISPAANLTFRSLPEEYWDETLPGAPELMSVIAASNYLGLPEHHIIALLNIGLLEWRRRGAKRRRPLRSSVYAFAKTYIHVPEIKRFMGWGRWQLYHFLERTGTHPVASYQVWDVRRRLWDRDAILSFPEFRENRGIWR